MAPWRRVWPFMTSLHRQRGYSHLPGEDDAMVQLIDKEPSGMAVSRVAWLETAPKHGQVPPPVNFPAIDLPPVGLVAVERPPDRRLEAQVGIVAGRCSSLRTELLRIAGRCGHVSTRQDISDVAEELLLSSSTLWKVQHALMANRKQYSSAFNEDLEQIIRELDYCCDEITECCVGMLGRDDPTTAVPWFFKKGRVAKLTKHLIALKATLTTMRYVLWIGKDAAKGTAGHILNDERCIIEAALARNSDAISGLETFVTKHDLARMPRTANDGDEGGSTIKHTPASKLSIVSDNEDAIPLSATSDADQSHVHLGSPPTPVSELTQLTRRFTKRRPLRIHESMASMETSEMSTELMKKWIRGPPRKELEESPREQTEQSSEFLTEPKLPARSIIPRSSADFFGASSQESLPRGAQATQFIPEPETRPDAKRKFNVGATLRHAMQTLSLRKKDAAADDYVKDDVEANKEVAEEAICACGKPEKDHNKRPEPSWSPGFKGFLERLFGVPMDYELTDDDFYDTEAQQSGR